LVEPPVPPPAGTPFWPSQPGTSPATARIARPASIERIDDGGNKQMIGLQ